MSNTANLLHIDIDSTISLRHITLEDANDIFHTIDSQREYLERWLPFVPFTQTVNDSIAFVKSTLNVPPNQAELLFTIRYNNEFIGLIGFKDTDRANRKTEIGYWLSEAMQGRGIVTKSVKALVCYAFDELDINRVQIKCAVGNTPSKRIPQRLGFVLEGIERDGELLANGQFTDLEVYSLTGSDYGEEWQKNEK
ncbi:MAG: GNAT family protein [Tenuifilaceae bacterium]|jgi:ribosomal-protein-serine acetyltransferase|nr:GNAT family protein [Tenuifilaceae bacterium]